MNLPLFCVGCQIELQCVRNGVVIVHMAQSRPYALYLADLFACPNCKSKQFKWALHPYICDNVEIMNQEIARIKAIDEKLIFEVWQTIAERNEYQLKELRDAGVKI